MGSGHSGSTILGVALGNCADIFFSGELQNFLARSGEPMFGGLERTRFWASVRSEVPDASELYGTRSLRLLERSLSVFRVREWRQKRRLRPPYRRVTQELYEAIARVAGRVREKDVSAVMKRLMVCWANEPGSNFSWGHAILRAARRAETLAVVEEVVRNLADHDEWQNLAITAARDFVALLAEVVPEQRGNLSCAGKFAWTGKLIPMQRDDKRLVLDPYLAVAPKPSRGLGRKSKNWV